MPPPPLATGFDDGRDGATAGAVGGFAGGRAVVLADVVPPGAAG
jgi:hypothetical protein